MQGCNMFAYCFNNPVNMFDSSGHWPKWGEDAKDWMKENVTQPVKQFISEIKEDVSNYDKNNQSEKTVLASNYFSSYKGVPVFRTNGDRSGSFGAMFVTRETNERADAEDIVRHEYGHTVQLKELGVLNYTLGIMIPSWLEWGGGDYYSRPFELTADLYGRVQSRTYSHEDIVAGFLYLDTIKSSGPLIWFTCK